MGLTLLLLAQLELIRITICIGVSVDAYDSDMQIADGLFYRGVQLLTYESEGRRFKSRVSK